MSKRGGFRLVDGGRRTYTKKKKKRETDGGCVLPAQRIWCTPAALRELVVWPTATKQSIHLLLLRCPSVLCGPEKRGKSLRRRCYRRREMSSSLPSPYCWCCRSSSSFSLFCLFFFPPFLPSNSSISTRMPLSSTVIHICVDRSPNLVWYRLYSGPAPLLIGYYQLISCSDGYFGPASSFFPFCPRAGQKYIREDRRMDGRRRLFHKWGSPKVPSVVDRVNGASRTRQNETRGRRHDGRCLIRKWIVMELVALSLSLPLFPLAFSSADMDSKSDIEYSDAGRWRRY